MKSGLYAYLNLAGFYIDTNWIGDNAGSKYPGLYWGIKNLVATCSDCGEEPCVSQAINKLLDLALDELGITNATSVSSLPDSDHKNKDSIKSLDNSIVGDDMPTGDPEQACWMKPAGDGSLRRRWWRRDDDEDVYPRKCHPAPKGGGRKRS